MFELILSVFVFVQAPESPIGVKVIGRHQMRHVIDGDYDVCTQAGHVSLSSFNAQIGKIYAGKDVVLLPGSECRIIETV